MYLSYRDSIAMLASKTYMSEEDAATLLKFEYHKPKFEKQMGRLPTMEESVTMMEHFRKDKSLTYHNLEYPTALLNAVIIKALKTYPILKDD